MEKTESVDQKANARWERVRLQILGRRRLFARQGAVVAGWRTYRNRRLGPYFRLAYREAGRQRSIYLGRCAELARRVGQLLAGLQRPLRDRRLFARLKAQVRASLRLAKAELERTLAPWGIRLQGFEFRGGVRKVMQAYVSSQGSGDRGKEKGVRRDGAGSRGWGLEAGIGRSLVTTLCVVTRMPDALPPRSGAAGLGEGDAASTTRSVPAGRSHAERGNE